MILNKEEHPNSVNLVQFKHFLLNYVLCYFQMLSLYLKQYDYIISEVNKQALWHENLIKYKKLYIKNIPSAPGSQSIMKYLLYYMLEIPLYITKYTFKG